MQAPGRLLLKHGETAYYSIQTTCYTIMVRSFICYNKYLTKRNAFEGKKNWTICPQWKTSLLFHQLNLGDGIWWSEKSLKNEGKPRKKVAWSQKWSMSKSRMKWVLTLCLKKKKKLPLVCILLELQLLTWHFASDTPLFTERSFRALTSLFSSMPRPVHMWQFKQGRWMRWATHADVP